MHGIGGAGGGGGGVKPGHTALMIAPWSPAQPHPACINSFLWANTQLRHAVALPLFLPPAVQYPRAPLMQVHSVVFGAGIGLAGVVLLALPPPRYLLKASNLAAAGVNGPHVSAWQTTLNSEQFALNGSRQIQFVHGKPPRLEYIQRILLHRFGNEQERVSNDEKLLSTTAPSTHPPTHTLYPHPTHVDYS